MIQINPKTGLVAASTIAAFGLLALLALGSSVAGSATVADAGATTLDDHDEDRYSVVQGDRCIQIEPLGDGDRTVDMFYDYRNPFTTPSGWDYSSQGTTHLQEDDTSLIMLHEGADGISLVIVHDRLDGDTDGGAATFQIDNLPEDGQWVVEDDNYSGTVNGTYIEADAEWEHGDDWSRITWVWNEARTDGGAFNGGLDDEFAIEIDPAFNNLADFREGPGEITDWQVLSGDEANPERTSLNLNQPIEIRSGGCVVTSNLDIKESVETGEEVEVTATVENTGTENETVTVPIEVDGELVDEHELTLDAGETATVTSAVEFDAEGDVMVAVGETDATVSVSDTSDDDESDGLPGFGVLVAIGAILLAVALGRWR